MNADHRGYEKASPIAWREFGFRSAFHPRESGGHFASILLTMRTPYIGGINIGTDHWFQITKGGYAMRLTEMVSCSG